MGFLTWLQQFFEDLGNGILRIFSARDDDYPEVGVQPFEGEPTQNNNNY